MPRHNTGSVENENVVGQDEKGDCVQELLKNNSLSIWLSFLETFTESPRVYGVSSY